MAPTRRSKPPKKRLDLELTGMAAFGMAAILGIAMITPPSHAGGIGFFVRRPLVLLFGNAAGEFPLVIALIGAIFFLEVTESGVTLSLTLAISLYYLLFDIAEQGGVVGGGLNHGLQMLFGDLTVFVLWICFALLTFAITGISIKRSMTRIVRMLRRVRIPNLVSLSLLSSHHDDDEYAEPVAARKRREPKVHIVPDVVEVAGGVMRVPPFLADREHADTAEEGTRGPVARPPVSPPPSHARRAPALETMVQAEPRKVETIHEDIRWHDDSEVVGRISDSEYTEHGVRKHRTYELPHLSIFDMPAAQVVDDGDRSKILRDTLDSFGVGVEVVHAERGPSITRYELKPHKGVKISRISALADDLALALAATSVRIEAPIPGKSAVGIEVPNAVVSIVALREILEALPRVAVPALPMALGKDITGRAVYGDLAKMPHLLVAGATGAGKSVCLNSIIASLLTFATPDQVQMLMIDPKRVELTVYNGIPHLVKDVITDARLAAGALFEMTKEMDSRYERFARAGVRKIEEYNAKFPQETLPYVVIVIDELADLMLVAPAKVETTICRLAQLARATGIHLIVATQRPSVDVITGIIKANIPSRIAFAVSSQIDSRTILDMGGAERLLGRGDMLYLPIDAPKPKRAQGALVTGDEVSRLVAFWAAQARPRNLVDVEVVPLEDEDNSSGLDPLSYEAARFIIETNYASTAQLQSKFQIGHPRAVRLMKGLEEMKVVGPHEGTKPRKILLGLGDLELMASRFGKNGDVASAYQASIFPEEQL